MDFYGFYTGKIFDAYQYLGAHTEKTGVTFRTFAPSASRIAVIYATLLLLLFKNMLMFTPAALAISPLSDYLLGLDDPLPYISLFLSLLPV